MDPERAAVARVIDAETLALDDGREVRLIGALAPRAPLAAAETPWPAEVAARRALENLVVGRAVELRFGKRRRDRYGRLLAHVWADGRGAGDPASWVQERMVRLGHARAYALAGNAECLAEMLAAEREARDRRAGLWANAIFAIRSAEETDSLAKRAGQFEVVEGTVQRVSVVSGGQVYLNFGRNWRRDFTVLVPGNLLKGDERALTRLKSHEGQRVRVRGWIERRNGPLIAVADLEEIETFEADPK